MCVADRFAGCIHDDSGDDIPVTTSIFENNITIKTGSILDAHDKCIGFTYCEDLAVPPSSSNSSLQKTGPKKSVEMNRDNYNKEMKSDEKCNVEPAIVKVAPKPAPQCVCGVVLDVCSLDTGIKDGVHVMCNQCS